MDGECLELYRWSTLVGRKGTMLTIYTASQVARIPWTKVYRVFGRTAYRTMVDATHNEFDSFLGYLEGDKCPTVALHAFSLIDKLMVHSIQLRRQYEGILVIPPLPCLTLNGNDGGVARLPLTQVRHFTLLSDFLGDYPSVTSIDLPYPAETIKQALFPITHDSKTHLLSCLDCVKYLNPVRNTYYLDFILSGMTGEEMKCIATQFTESERDELRHLYEIQGDAWPLPNSGLDYGILCASQAVRAEEALCYSLFHESYPSWLYCHMNHRSHSSLAGTLLLTADFTRERAQRRLHEDMKPRIQAHLLRIIKNEKTLSWNEMKRLFLLLGRVHKLLDNDELDICAPYGISVSTTSTSFGPLRERFMAVYPHPGPELAWSCVEET